VAADETVTDSFLGVVPVPLGLREEGDVNGTETPAKLHSLGNDPPTKTYAQEENPKTCNQPQSDSQETRHRLSVGFEHQ